MDIEVCYVNVADDDYDDGVDEDYDDDDTEDDEDDECDNVNEDVGHHEDDVAVNDDVLPPNSRISASTLPGGPPSPPKSAPITPLIGPSGGLELELELVLELEHRGPCPAHCNTVTTAISESLPVPPPESGGLAEPGRRTAARLSPAGKELSEGKWSLVIILVQAVLIRLTRLIRGLVKVSFLLEGK